MKYLLEKEVFPFEIFIRKGNIPVLSVITWSVSVKMAKLVISMLKGAVSRPNGKISRILNVYQKVKND